MRIFFLLCLLVTGLGCQVTPNNPDTDLQLAALSTSDIEALEAQRQSFLSAPELAERLQHLLELEQQALQLAVDEPLKLGSIGSAILDEYPGSQTGHYVMSRFYDHVESMDAKAAHDAELLRLQTYMRSAADGTSQAPYRVMTVYDAHAYAHSNNSTPVGSLYQIPDLKSFRLLLVSRPENAALTSSHFDLSHVLDAFAEAPANGAEEQTGNTHPRSGADNPWTILRLLAAQMDSAAQAAIGRYLIQMQRYDDAISWLQVASRSGNVLANTSLARIYLMQAQASEDEDKQQELRELAMENHLHAIAMGSTTAMYTLANLYMNDYYGEENRSAAIPLLTKAGNLDHAESLLYLGYLHNAGREVPQDAGKASAYFARAAALNNTQAILSYGRFLTGLDEVDDNEDNSQIYQRLEELAGADEAEAMVILGNLYARGIATKASNRSALRWYKKAVKTAPANADIVNEVAWTLTVSDIPGLQRAKYAKNIMNFLMDEDEEARLRPEYLDTWAATHAASGDFERAIALQEQAIQQATSQQREDVLEILQGHLELFKSGATVSEEAP